MPTFTTIDEIKDLKLRPDDKEFSKCGTISIEDNKFKATFESDPKGAGVYLWVSKDKNNNYEILYVGKAKDGPKSRLSQHQNGINERTKKAQERREKICQCIKKKGSGKPLLLFFRESKNQRFRKDQRQIEVSRYSLDEEALILLLSPVLNRSRPPIVSQAESLINWISDRFEFNNNNVDHFKVWKKSMEGLGKDRLELIERALRKIHRYVRNPCWRVLDVGVTRSYKGLECGEMNNRPMLVFGKYANQKFADNGKFALLALDNGDPKKEEQPDILFFKKNDKCLCRSYEEFVSKGFSIKRQLDDGVKDQLDKIVKDINEESEKCLR